MKSKCFKNCNSFFKKYKKMSMKKILDNISKERNEHIINKEYIELKKCIMRDFFEYFNIPNDNKETEIYHTLMTGREIKYRKLIKEIKKNEDYYLGDR